MIVMRWRAGLVLSIDDAWRGAVALTARLDPPIGDDPPSVAALAYVPLVGTPQVGDRVLLNLNALTLGLGTGGYAFVVALPDRLPPDSPLPRHGLVKARYTPHQVVTPAPPAVPDQLDGLPAVTADLHSALPAIIAGITAGQPDARIAYVVTDGGALPLWFSRSLATLRARLAVVVTTGQAFGGDIEAVNIHSGLLAARGAGATIAVVAPGPGNLGTATAWGFSGTSVGEAINAIATLGGRPVGALRLSFADPRPRHRGISHHSLTAYGRVALALADLVLPALPAPLLATVTPQLTSLTGRHRVVTIDATTLDPVLRSLELSTMGRGFEADPWYFRSAAVAGAHAASLIP